VSVKNEKGGIEGEKTIKSLVCHRILHIYKEKSVTIISLSVITQYLKGFVGHGTSVMGYPQCCNE